MSKQFHSNVRHMSLLALAALSVSGAASAQQPTKVTPLEATETYGYATADYNGDGLLDHLATGHDPDSEWLWFSNADGSFRKGVQFLGRNAQNGPIDRHGCVAADFNRDGRTDLYCTVGAVQGEGKGANELWLQAADGSFVRDNASHGATDIYGRGRHALAFRFNKGVVPDLYVVNLGEPRPDGKPNQNRVFVNDGTGKFKEAITLATTPMLSTCEAAGDVNADGFDDLLVCPRNEPARLYVNTTKKNFSLMALPMANKHWWTARFARINKDARDDLVVTTTSGELQVFLNTGVASAPYGAEPTWRASLPNVNAVALAIGDLDGDKVPDIYVVMRDVVSFDGPNCQGSDSVDDVVFMSKGQPANQWRMEQLNQGYTGCGYAVDFLGMQRIALSQGGKEWVGPQYILDWTVPTAASVKPAKP